MTYKIIFLNELCNKIKNYVIRLRLVIGIWIQFYNFVQIKYKRNLKILFLQHFEYFSEATP